MFNHCILFLFLQVITIFAFATVAGFVGHFEFTVTCKVSGPVTSRVVKADFYYPFKQVDWYVSKDKLCINETEALASQDSLSINYRSEAEYFVFTGVVSMLFVLVAAIYYVFFEDRAKDATSTDVGLFSFPVVVRLLLLFLYKELNYSRIPISRTSKGNKSWFKKSGV